jgi:tetratricopeptide (TPR) repeat protein
LKVVKPGMDTRHVVARFEAERQALAMMDHPNIAKVHDGGATPSGRPYFVMELVQGVPITEYCDQNQLTPRQRLELFLPVCQAVQHAHHKGIIHRDLKPSNVLVSQHETTPVVKVIDFGVAKAVGQNLTDKTLSTGFAQMIGTPLYMSPEQAQLNGQDIDTRSDIYSLGVLLYELLTGTTPLDKERLGAGGYDEMRRIIREEELPRPSARVSTLDPAATTASSRRQSDPRRLSQLLRGELDWIVMKALEKDRNRRYETANGLARDVERYLNDEPVAACPPSAWYRFRKFTRRRKITLVVAACAFLALAGIAGGIGWGVRDRAAREEALDHAVDRTLNETGPLIQQEKWSEALGAVERADQLLAAAGRTNRLLRLLELRTDLSMAERLERIYQRPDPALPVLTSSAGGKGPTIQERRGPSEQDFFMGRQADAEYARAFREFGIDIDSLAPAEAAAQIARSGIFLALIRALDEWGGLRMRARGRNDPGWKKLVTIARLADPDPWRNRCRDALLRRDRAAIEELADRVPTDQVSVRTLWLLGTTLRDVGAPDKAVSLLLRAQREYPSDLWINDALGDLSMNAFRPPRTDDALRFYSIALALRPTRPQLHDAIGVILQRKHDVEGAVHEYQAALRIDRNDAWAHINLGNVLFEKKDFEGASSEYRAALTIDPNIAIAHNNLGLSLINRKDVEGAIREYQAALKIEPDLAMAHNNLGNALRDKKDVEGAIREFQAALRINPNDGGAHNNLGNALRDKKDVEGAIREFQAAIREFQAVLTIDPSLAVAHNNLGNALREKKDVEGAIREYQAALKIEPGSALVQDNLGNALRDLVGLRLREKGDLAGAITTWQKILEKNPPEHGPWYGYAELCLFLKQEEKYRGHRTDLLARFGGTKDPAIAERVSRACLLLPAPADELQRAAALAERAIGAGPKHPYYDYFLAAKGLAEYRLGHFDSAIDRLQQAESRGVWMPVTRLVLAMARQRSGQTQQARETLAAALASWDWSETAAVSQDEWIGHVLRGEAEPLVVANLPVFLDGKYEPHDRKERLELIEACRFRKRHATVARLYTDLFAAEPTLADDPRAFHRYRAACTAALAGIGQGHDADKHSDDERARWRQQALHWLRADLALYAERLERDEPPSRAFVRNQLEWWQKDDGLIGIRESAALAKLPAGERASYAQLWSDVETLLRKTRGQEK